MFSNNGRISQKQLKCLVTMPVFASGVLVLPHMLAKLYEENLVYGIAAFIAASAIYVGILFFEGSGYKRKRINGSYRVAAVIDIIRNYIRLIFYILLSMAVLMEGQVPFVESKMGNSPGNMLILLPLVMVALYGAGKGLEAAGRLYEMIRWSLIFPYVIMIAFGLKEMDFALALPKRMIEGNHSPMGMIYTSFALLTFIIPVENYLRLKLRTEDDQSTGRKIYMSVMIWIAVICAVSFFVVGIYGVRGAAGEDMVSIAIMRYIELPLGVLQRFDVLMVWFFMTGCFVLINSTMSTIRLLLDDLCSEKTAKVILVTMTAFALLTALRCPGYEEVVFGFMVFGMLVDVPLSIIMPLFRWLDLKRLKRLLFALLAVFNVLILSGCSKGIENIEQRDYATVMMITLPEEVTPVFGLSNKRESKRYHFTLAIAREKRMGEKGEAENIVDLEADSFEELAGLYGDTRGKDLSLSHLKILMVGYEDTAFANNIDIYDYKGHGVRINPGNNLRELIYEMDGLDEVARTCPLVLVDDNLEISEYLKNADIPVGSYLDNLVSVAEREKRDIPKLMDYLKAFREGKQILLYGVKTREDSLMLYCKGML